ncbi:MAG: rRNA (cytidine2498-2-O)-methyltransferase [Pseudomonadota bacterium]|jgi:23S rRNA (cytidine2498-2'-O)-methyltransferase
MYCRAGFEKECAAEICDQATQLGISGYARAKPDSGYVLYVPHDPAQTGDLFGQLRYRQLVFARQLLAVAPLLTALPVGDRITPLLEQVRAMGQQFGTLWLETADTNEAKELSAFCRKFEKPFAIALQKAGLLVDDPELPRLHLFFLGSAAAHVGLSTLRKSSPWPMGIPRLRMPRGAPSRSTMKLAEAILHFGLERWLDTGQTAVDLGASPGGWSWQLVQRGIHVTAIDNGPMDKALLATEMVEHLRTDGFHYRPKRPVQWLVCDMIEKPSRIATLMADWICEGHAQQAVFNLKLPMKTRFEELARCREIIRQRFQAAGLEEQLTLRQLYHDREEVTAHLRRRDTE